MVRQYKDSDFEEIQSWGKKWNTNYDKDMFPPLGFIIPGVCAYFIYETDSKVCWLENMVCNQDVPKEERDSALNQVVTATLREVQRLGYKKAYATTDLRQVIDRAVDHGATASSGQTLLSVSFK